MHEKLRIPDDSQNKLKQMVRKCKSHSKYQTAVQLVLFIPHGSRGIILTINRNLIRNLDNIRNRNQYAILKYYKNVVFVQISFQSELSFIFKEYYFTDLKILISLSIVC